MTGLAGCSGGDGNQTQGGTDSDGDDGGSGGQNAATVKFTHLGTFGSEAGKFGPQFEEQNPNITFENQQTPAQSSSTHDYYVNQFVSQSGSFDIGQMDVIWPAEFSGNDWLEPMDDPEGLTDTMLSTSVEAATVDGQLVGMPLYTDANALYYRKDILDKYDMDPPETYMGLVNKAQTIMEEEDKDWNGYIWQGGANEGLTIMWLNWLWGMDGTIHHNDELKVNTEKGIRALQHARDLIYKHEVSPRSVVSGQTDGNRQTFQNGSTLFMRNWPYAYSTMNEEGSSVKDKFEVTTMPKAEGHPDANNSCLGGWNAFVNKFSENKEAAKQFCYYMATEEAQATLATEFSRLPIQKSIYEDDQYIEEFPQLEIFKDILEQTSARPATAQYTTFSDILQTELNSCLSEQKSPEKALNEAQKKIDSDINNA